MAPKEYLDGCVEIARIYNVDMRDMESARKQDPVLDVGLRPGADPALHRTGSRVKTLPCFSDMANCHLPPVSDREDADYLADYPFTVDGKTAYLAKWVALIGPNMVQACVDRCPNFMSVAARNHHADVRRRIADTVRRRRATPRQREPADGVLSNAVQVGPELDTADLQQLLDDIARDSMQTLHDADCVDMFRMTAVSDPASVPEQLGPCTPKPEIHRSPKKRRLSTTVDMVVVLNKGQSPPLAVAQGSQLYVPSLQ